MLIHFKQLGTRGFIILVVICFCLIFAVSANACRMWGIVSDTPQATIMQEQLASFRSFGNSSNDNGWAMGYFYPGTPNPFIFPIIRRGGPMATLDPDYVLAMNEVIQVSPRAALAHVRNATSGAAGIPNPHPFMEQGWMFCHNGSVNTNVLINLIGQTYLNQHPLDYTNPNIDSELYFVYLMKTIHEMADPTLNNEKAPGDEVPICTVETAIKTAVANLDSALNQAGSYSQLTFLLTNGKKLWGCRYADINQAYYSLYYSLTGPGNNWSVASEPVSNGQWIPIQMYHVMTFIPGYNPVDTAIPHVGL